MDLILKRSFFLLIILHIHIKFDGACQIDLRTYLKKSYLRLSNINGISFYGLQKPFPFYWAR